MYWPLLSTTWPPHTCSHTERENETTHMAYFKTRFVVFFQPLDNYTSFFTSICSFQSYVRFFLRLFLWLSLVQCNFLTDVVILVFCFFSFLFSFAVLFLFGFFLYTVSLPRVFILFRSFLVILSFYYKRRPIENQHPLDPRLRSRLKIARTHTHTHRLTDSCIGFHIVVQIKIFTSNHRAFYFISALYS